MQKCVPHPFWVDFMFVYVDSRRATPLTPELISSRSPESRDAFIRHQGVLSSLYWAEVIEQTRIKWIGEIMLAVQVDSVSAQFHLTPEFITTLLDIQNWVFPNLFDVIALREPTGSSMDIADAIGSQDETI